MTCFRSGWAVRNRRLYHPGADGTFLFPASDGLVVDPTIGPVQEFLRRMAGWRAAPVSAH